MSAITGGKTPAQVSVDQIRGDLPVSDLVTHARKGEQHAWDALIERYALLVWPICLRHRLDGADAYSKAPPGRPSSRPAASFASRANGSWTRPGSGHSAAQKEHRNDQTPGSSP